MTIPAGVQPPAPHTLDDVGVVHAVDGDGTAFCIGTLALEQIDSERWNDVPAGQRCPDCDVTLTALGA